jgi:hypothetical protein
MGFMDSIKERFGNKSKAQEMARDHSDKVDQGIDRAGRAADDRTGGKHSEQIDKGTERAKDATGKWSGEGDDKH